MQGKIELLKAMVVESEIIILKRIYRVKKYVL